MSIPIKQRKVEPKELAQCLALAYFAEYPNHTDKDHDNTFYQIYNNPKIMEKLKKHLSQYFPFDRVAPFFEINKSPIKGDDSIHKNVKIVYLVAKKVHQSNMLSGEMNQYKYIDQQDPTFNILKDITLNNIGNALKLKYKADVLSAVDIFAIKKSSETKIKTTFIKYFSDVDTILKNATSGGKSYKNVVRSFIKTGELYPISLKLPVTISGNIHIRKVDVISTDSDASVEIDPFTKFLALILDNPNKTRELINKVIDIRFDKFRIGERLDWEFPVTFRYKEIIDPDTNMPFVGYDLNFNLAGQGHAAGWNGKFDASTVKHHGTQWVGGVSANSFEVFARKYPEYDSVISKLVSYRLGVFDNLTKQMKEKDPEVFRNLNQKYISARNDILKKEIVSLTIKNRKIKDFFDSYSKETGLIPNDVSLFHTYCLGVINEVRNKIKAYSGTNNTKEDIIEAHYGHAQIAFFLFLGGQNYDLYFKQRMFMTIFGAITKKAHKLIGIDDYKGMRDIIREDIELNGRKFSAEFSTPPHYIIS